MAKSKELKKWLCIGAVVVVVIDAIIVGVVVAKGNNSDSGLQTGNSLTANDLSSVDVEIEYGDFDAMQDLSKEIQNGRATGKIVKIDGLVMHPATSYSVVQENEKGTMKVGTVFHIENATESEYPDNEDRIVITGKVVEEEPLVYTIQTLKEFVEVVE